MHNRPEILRKESHFPLNEPTPLLQSMEAGCREFAEGVLNFMSLPGRLIQGMLSKDFIKRNELLISLSPEINSINDQTGFSIKGVSFDRNRYWGYLASSSLGTNFGAMYAFLPNFLMWKTGVCGYSLFSLLIYAGLYVHLWFRSPDWVMWPLVCAASLYSPYFKNSAFICGRYDVPGWPLLINGILFLSTGHPSIAFLFLSVALMTHPSIALVGWVYMVLFVFMGFLPAAGIGYFLAAQGVNLFWYIPFLNTILRVHKIQYQWSAPAPDRTRSLSVKLRKTGGMLIFIVPYVLSVKDYTAIGFIAVPFILALYSFHREKFLNRFSLELLWLSSGSVALGQHSTALFCLLFLISLYVYAAPSPRFGFPFKPFSIPLRDLDKAFAPLAENLPPNSRIAYAYFARNADQWRLNAKYSCLFSNWAIRHPNNYERLTVTLPPFGGDVTVTMDVGINREMKEKSLTYAISYYLAPDPDADILRQCRELSVLQTFSIPEIGSVPSQTFTLFKTTFAVSKIIPEGKVSVRPNGLHCKTTRSGKHEIKYNTLGTLRAYQGSAEIPIREGRNLNFIINPTTPGAIEIRSDPMRLWLPFSCLNSRHSRGDRHDSRIHG